MSAVRCCVCGSRKWFACAPGTEAEDREQGDFFMRDPALEVPSQAWCVAHHDQQAQAQTMAGDD
jgi:hypothetical protein